MRILLLSAQNVLHNEFGKYSKNQIDEVKNANWLTLIKTNRKMDVNGTVDKVDFDAYAKAVGRQKTTQPLMAWIYPQARTICLAMPMWIKSILPNLARHTARFQAA
ncbi:hypothetical protein [Alysiella filiformis]|uniref:hypothetical protein n=1 Tax=Alysiella filiformis TaxID=194196 RepID=UPI00117879F2|nr:hypothetical protein [Alysiella filiformis]QMT31423.1 hypothetical protein H3L97_00445 [Alysiella filiformis]